jgi:hypothetical protein
MCDKLLNPPPRLKPALSLQIKPFNLIGWHKHIKYKGGNLDRLIFEIVWRESGIPDCICRVIELSALRNEMAESFYLLFDLKLE